MIGVTTVKKRIKMFLASAVGMDRYRLGKRDLLGAEIMVCTTCGAHFIGDTCPTVRH